MSRRLRFPISYALCIAAAIVACESNRTTAPADGRQHATASSTRPVSSKGQEAQCDTILITAPTTNIAISGTVQLTAQAFNSHGKPLDNVLVAWSSFNPSVAAVNSSGFVTGVGAGSAIVRATCLATSAVGDIQINVQ
jgi:hypothetical protein